jgi:hypothetical protein
MLMLFEIIDFAVKGLVLFIRHVLEGSFYAFQAVDSMRPNKTGSLICILLS